MNILKTDRFISEKLLIAPMSKTRLADVGAKAREEKRLLEATFDVIQTHKLNCQHQKEVMQIADMTSFLMEKKSLEVVS